MTDLGNGTLTKQELGEMLAAYKEQISFLKAELEEARKREEKLNLQVERLQGGLMNIRAPEAYKDMRADAYVPTASADMAEAREREAKKMAIREQYVRNMEGDIFRSQEDIEDLMNTVLLAGNRVGSKSLHGNNES